VNLPEDGIRDFLSPEMAAAHERFLEEYTAIRHGEGRGWDTADNYLIFPFVKIPGPLGEEVKLRAMSLEWLWRYLTNHVQKNADREWNPLTLLDAGAGTCWLARYLAEWGHTAVAVDITTDSRDGLRAGRHYLENLPITFDRVRAGFEDLPFASESFDAVIFNGSIHYALDMHAVLTEAARLIRPEGAIVIIDSPFYHDSASGEKMLREREGNARSGYLTYDRLREHADALGLCIEIDLPEQTRSERIRRRLRELRIGREIAEMPRVAMRDKG
jgi:SAM-dependent methyltransferase